MENSNDRQEEREYMKQKAQLVRDLMDMYGFRRLLVRWEPVNRFNADYRLTATVIDDMEKNLAIEDLKEGETSDKTDAAETAGKLVRSLKEGNVLKYGENIFSINEDLADGKTEARLAEWRSQEHEAGLAKNLDTVQKTIDGIKEKYGLGTELTGGQSPHVMVRLTDTENLQKFLDEGKLTAYRLKQLGKVEAGLQFSDFVDNADPEKTTVQLMTGIMRNYYDYLNVNRTDITPEMIPVAREFKRSFERKADLIEKDYLAKNEEMKTPEFEDREYADSYGRIYVVTDGDRLTPTAQEQVIENQKYCEVTYRYFDPEETPIDEKTLAMVKESEPEFNYAVVTDEKTGRKCLVTAFDQPLDSSDKLKSRAFGKWLAVMNPETEERLGCIAYTSTEDVDKCMKKRFDAQPKADESSLQKKVEEQARKIDALEKRLAEQKLTDTSEKKNKPGKGIKPDFDLE